MASFTDNVDKLTQFNPYVQQLPIEAMVNVGVQKQQQYNEGVQRIQQQIDNVAGIDVVRDVDKMYLQSKLNELGGNLKKVAAADFSNYQLQNSVGGMVTKIAKDPSIQNAAISTSNYRNQVQKMQKDMDAGTSNPANIDYFQKQANSWLSSPKAGEKFNGQYVPHFDVFKFAKETFDAVKPDGYSFDQLYITDTNGVPKTDAQGRPIASPMMKRLEKEGIFPDKVRQTLNQIFSDPRVDTQLSISGEYNYKGLSPQMLSQRISGQKDKIVGDLTNQLNSLTILKNTGKNVQDQIDAVQLQIDNTKIKYDEYSMFALQNPDAIRASLYKDDVRSNYTSMFGWTKTKEQAMESPLWNANFRLNQEANRVTEFREKMDFEKSKELWDRNYKLLDLNLKAAKEAKKTENPNVAIQDAQSSDPYLGSLQFDKNYEEAANNYKDKSNEFIYSMVMKNPQNDAELQSLIRAGNSKEKATDVLMRNQARNSFLSQGVEPTTEMINQAVSDTKSRLEGEAVTAINRMSPTEKERNSDIVDNYNNYVKAKRQFENTSILKGEVEKRIGDRYNQVLDSEKVKVSGSPKIGNKSVNSEDLYNAVIMLKGRRNSLGFLNPKELRDQANIAENKLREAGREDIINAVMSNPDELGDSGITTKLQRSFMTNTGPSGNKDFFDNFNKLYKSIDDKTVQEAVQAKSSVLKELGYSVSPNLRLPILTGNAENDRGISQKILSTAGNYTTEKQNASPDFDYTVIESILNSKDNVKPFELKTRKNDVTGEVMPELVFYGDNGKREAAMTITPEEALSLGTNVNSLYESPDIKVIRDRMSASPLGSTSIGDPKDISTYIQGDAYFQKDDFPNLIGSKYDIKANLYSNNGLVYPVVYVYDGISSPRPRTLPGQKDVADAVDKLKNITPTFVNSLLNEK